MRQRWSLVTNQMRQCAHGFVDTLAHCDGARHLSREVRVSAGGLDCEHSFIEPDAGVVSRVSLLITLSCAVTRRIDPGVDFLYSIT
jgi:hypothetical protein